MTLEELGGQRPAAGMEIVYRETSYLIVNAKPPKAFPSRWKKTEPGTRHNKWKLLVEKLEQSQLQTLSK
jgi:hypothetical protein